MILMICVMVCVAVLAHCEHRGSEVLLGDLAHIFLYEQAGMAQVSGAGLPLYYPNKHACHLVYHKAFHNSCLSHLFTDEAFKLFVNQQLDNKKLLFSKSEYSKSLR